MKRIFAVILVMKVMAIPLYAGFFDDITVISEEEVKKMESEIVRLKKENQSLREELDRLKKGDEQREEKPVPGDDYKVLLAMSALSDGDTGDYLDQGDNEWYILVRLNRTIELSAMKVLLKKTVREASLSFAAYDEASERWRFIDELEVTGTEHTYSFNRTVRTDRVRLVPSENVKNLNDLRITDISLIEVK